MNIWKFPLELKAVNRVQMPRTAKVLSVGNQYETICVWAEVGFSPKAVAWTERVFIMRVTGFNELGIDEAIDLQFLGTVCLRGGNFVAHIYEATKREALA